MITKLKCLLLDDELPALSYIKVLCEQIPGVEVVRAFNDPEKFLVAADLLPFDLCILDIQMPGRSGLEIARKLKDKLTIFTTAHKEFAAEAFDLNAVDYLVKPLQKDRFEKAITKAVALQASNGTLDKYQTVWNTDKGKTLLASEEILYITSSGTDSRDKLFLLKNGQKIRIKNTRFEQILALLPPEKFCRINKKEIIALHIVQHFSAGNIVSAPYPKNQLPPVFQLSDVYRDDFRKKIAHR